jgi:acyl-coenzyme A synthetase/AMP-(fatty) acid ligase
MGYFFIDRKNSVEISWENLIHDINQCEEVNSVCFEKDTYSVFKVIIQSIVHNNPLILLDSDLSETEREQLGVADHLLKEKKSCKPALISSLEELISLLNHRIDWSLTLFTSGTTGLPKKIDHPLANFLREARISENRNKDIWGFAYNPTHIAGLQVFFQALFNRNTIIDLFHLERKEIFALIEEFSISNISSTPTFFRLLLPPEKSFSSVQRITLGGEKFDENLAKNLQMIFPNAKILNVYASTEAGTIFAAHGDLFRLKPSNEHLVRIEDNELLLHKSLLGRSENITLENDWYHTGDLVEMVSTSPQTFRFISRKNEMINVGGYKVNPLEIEELLNKHPSVKKSLVYGKENKLVGNILMCDVEIQSGQVTEKELKDYLFPLLQPFKIPRIINLVENIELTRTGKIKRV